MILRSSAFALALGLCAVPAIGQAQTMTNLLHPAPEGADLTLQLIHTDGTVLAQSASDGNHWYKLTPDVNGSYQKGTWSRMANMPTGYQPYAMASAVLADGRVIAEGGEYQPGSEFSLTNLGAIYDPKTNTWTANKPPKHWHYIGDSSSLVLPDGRYLLGAKLSTDMAAFDPKTGKWTELGSEGHRDFNSEETWTLLPDGKVLTLKRQGRPEHPDLRSRHRRVDRFRQDAAEAQRPEMLQGDRVRRRQEISSAGRDRTCDPDARRLDLRDGRDPEEGDHGAHRDLQERHLDLRPRHPQPRRHRRQFRLAPAERPRGVPGPERAALRVRRREPDQDDELQRRGQQPDGAADRRGAGGRLGGLCLARSPDPSWAPAITNCPSTLARGGSFEIDGRQFNGLSQANSFGDELQTFTNYPLVRITNNATGHVFYARTHDHSTMGVATGSQTVSTHVDMRPAWRRARPSSRSSPTASPRRRST